VQALIVYPRGASDVAVGHIEGMELHVLREMLVPSRARLGRPNQLLDYRSSLGLVGGKGCSDIPTVRVERISERNRIFESEARSGADRVVRRAQRIPPSVPYS
jgi:hypothetical protein